MAIKSSAFGRVTLTGPDAKKFKRQVTYGKPNAAAVETVKSGVAMSRKFSADGGKVRVTLKKHTA